jgi:uncharacterized protein (TIGR02757 family)
MRIALEDLRRSAIQDGVVEQDPLSSVLAYSDPADQEIAGLIGALLAYGRVDLLQAHVDRVLALLGDHPARSLRCRVPHLPPDLVYRFHRTSDIDALLRGTRRVLLERGSLGAAFAAHWKSHGALRPALTGFVEEIRAGAGNGGGAGLKFLLADPARGGACKRWNLYLRWMVRCGPGDPDPGPWRGRMPTSALLIPLDTHIVRVGGRLGLTRRRTSNWKMAEEITHSLRRVDRDDPVRYDFPLCHLGISGHCPPRLKKSDCARCPLAGVCPTGGAKLRACS